MIENKEHIILTLQIVNANGNTNFLIELGYSYVQIAAIISHFRKEKYIDFAKGELTLTKSGKVYMDELNTVLGRKGISKFISPLIQYKIEKSGLFEVYLPILKDTRVERE